MFEKESEDNKPPYAFCTLDTVDDPPKIAGRYTVIAKAEQFLKEEENENN